MTFVGIGIDLVDVGEIRHMIELSRKAFLVAAWTEREISQSSERTEWLAAQWAAKEAVMKALGIGLGDISPLDVEIEMIMDPRPLPALYGDAAVASARLGVRNWHIACSTNRDWALVTAVAFGGPS